MTATKKAKCEHLNVETKKLEGVMMAVCKDCMKSVDPNEFEANEALKAERAGQPETANPDGLRKVGTVSVSGLVDVKEVGAPFFPVFNVKKGDLILILRKVT
jgi:hypothetical protein